MNRKIFPFVLLLCACAAAPEKREPPAAPTSYSETIPGTNVSFEMIYLPEKKIWLGKTEVTWDEYQRFCDEYNNPPPGVDAITRPSPVGHGIPERGLGLERQPAMGVTWNGAKEYCAWLSQKTGRKYRLPSEDEWHFAALGGSKTIYFDELQSAVAECGWFSSNSGGMTHPVATKKPNPYGFHDLLGNVIEYTADADPRNEKLPILRGGSFEDPPDLAKIFLRQDFQFKWIERDPQRPRSRWWAFDGPVGFRLARSE